MKGLMIFLFVLMMVILGPSSAMENYINYIRVDEMTMSLNRDDAIIQMNYTLNSFAYLYVLALGCNYIEPDLALVFKNFENAKVMRADPSSATFLIKGAGRNNRGYYLFDSKPLGSKISRLTIVYPGGISKTFYNVSSTPNVFSKA